MAKAVGLPQNSYCLFAKVRASLPDSTRAGSCDRKSRTRARRHHAKARTVEEGPQDLNEGAKLCGRMLGAMCLMLQDVLERCASSRTAEDQVEWENDKCEPVLSIHARHWRGSQAGP